MSASAVRSKLGMSRLSSAWVFPFSISSSRRFLRSHPTSQHIFHHNHRPSLHIRILNPYLPCITSYGKHEAHLYFAFASYTDVSSVPKAHAAVRQGILPSIASTSSISPAAFCTCSTLPTPLVSVWCLFVFVGHAPYLECTISQDPAFAYIRIWFSVTYLRQEISSHSHILLNHNANIYSPTAPTTARAANPQPHPRLRT
jgi:hypothetical protein